MDNYKEWINGKCNSGLEQGWISPYRYMKQPSFIHETADLQVMLDRGEYTIDWVIFPIRNYADCVISRATHGPGNVPGGFTGGCVAPNQQLMRDIYGIANFLRFMVTNDIATIFLDFDQMTTNKDYLYRKLKPILDDEQRTYAEFSQAYDFATEHQKK